MKKYIAITAALVLVFGFATTAGAYYNYGCCNYGYRTYGYTNPAYYNPYDPYQAGGYYYNPGVVYNRPYYGTGSVWGDVAYGVTGALLQNTYTGGYYNYNPSYAYAAPGFYPAAVCGPFGC